MKWLKYGVFGVFLAFLLSLFFHITTAAADFALPSLEDPFQLYFTETQVPLRSVVMQSIESAKTSLLVVVYQLRDDRLIEAIRKKSESGIPVYVVVDESGYDEGRKRLGKETILVKRSAPGIMHDKIIVVDKAQVYLGSTNFTFDSLNLHANDWVGAYSPSLAEKVWQRIKKLDKKGKVEPSFPIHAKLGTRPVELWFTPNPDALKKLEQLIDQAKVSIKVAMYTFTNQKLAQKLIDAKKRGVKVTVATDAGQSRNVNKLVLQQLQEAREYLGVGLFHHKFALIDDRILVIGSLNWTKQAFTQNDDCFMIIQQLTESDQSLLQKVWEAILRKSKGNEYAFGSFGLWENGKIFASPCTPAWTSGDNDPNSFLAKHSHQRIRHPRGRSLC